MQNPSGAPAEPTLSLRNLTISYHAARGMVRAVRGVNLDINPGETLALIGESGSGKTTLGLGMVRLLPNAAVISEGEIIYRRDGKETNILALNPRQLRQFRWKECAMVFQAAMNAFNPVLRICDHFADTSRAHNYLQGKALEERAHHLLSLVRLEPERVWRAYPHELSGGMRQRVLIALSLLLEPQLLILDEPSAALDTLTQRNLMDVLKELRARLNFSLIIISHDLSLAAELADRVAVMYAGEMIECSDVYTTFQNPVHPYTIGLIHAVPTLRAHKNKISSIPGSPPDLISLPAGCKFHPRCLAADDICARQEPRLEEAGANNHLAACWHWKTASKTLAAKR